MNKQELSAKIWETANKMRSKIEANEYKDYILGFIFYKFLSEKEIKYLQSIDWPIDLYPELVEEDIVVVRNIQQNIGYFIPYPYLFSTWIEQGQDFDSAVVTDALQSFERLIDPHHKNLFGNVFNTLQTGLSKLGDTSGARTKAIRNLIHLIDEIPMDGRQGYDVLGFIYEDLISKFASNAGKKAGEFYTPHEVSLLMSEIVADHLQGRDRIQICDCTSGSGSLLINIGKSIARRNGNGNHIKYYAQELKENTYNLTRMNLVMRGILPANIVTRNADTLEQDWPLFDDNDPNGTYERLYVDAVVSNPPYSQAWNSADKESDPRFARFGLAPKTKADYAFLLHDLYHLKKDGIVTIVLPHGVLFRGGEEGRIRRNLIENNHIHAIIGLPANIFFGTGIPTIIMVLRQVREEEDVLIIDASKGFAKQGKNNVLRASDIKRIVDTVISRRTTPKFSRCVSRDEIRQNDYNLNIPRYVDSAEEAETWDVYASMFGGIPKQELDAFNDYWTAFPQLKESLFAAEAENEAYSQLQTQNLKESIEQHPSVEAYFKRYKEVFADFYAYLEDKLITNRPAQNIPSYEEDIASNIFERLRSIPLVDPYEAYEILDEKWKEIMLDLETIQLEGEQAIRRVDPILGTKKKGGNDIQVQEGWAGHILPFKLVQTELLQDQLKQIQAKQERIEAVAIDLKDLIDEMPEEDKSGTYLNEAQDAFVPAEIKRVLKSKEAEGDLLTSLKKANELLNEEKNLKKEIREKELELETVTKERIENLSQDEIHQLLRAKWIRPILEGLHELPQQLMNKFEQKLEAIDKKYEDTLKSLEKEIKETESALIEMLDQLTGNEFDMKGIAEFKELLAGE